MIWLGGQSMKTMREFPNLGPYWGYYWRPIKGRDQGEKEPPMGSMAYNSDALMLMCKQNPSVAENAGAFAHAATLSMWPLCITYALISFLRAQKLANAGMYVSGLSAVFHVFVCYALVRWRIMQAFLHDHGILQLQVCVVLLSNTFCPCANATTEEKQQLLSKATPVRCPYQSVRVSHA